MGYACPDCGFKLWIPIAALSCSHLGLYDDRRFPGRAILVHDTHEEQLHHLSPEVRCAFIDDAARAAEAILAVTGSARINYAVLGNTQPHLHWHLVPRTPHGEPAPERPPWEDPRPRTPLDADTVTLLTDKIKGALGA